MPSISARAGSLPHRARGRGSVGSCGGGSRRRPPRVRPAGGSPWRSSTPRQSQSNRSQRGARPRSRSIRSTCPGPAATGRRPRAARRARASRGGSPTRPSSRKPGATGSGAGSAATATRSPCAPADPSGLAWSAVGLKVPHPDRPHRLTVAVVGGHPSALGVGLVAPGGSKGKTRVVLDACASGPPLIEGAGPATFSWLVWPDAAEPVLVLVNRGGTSSVRLGAITLTELADVPAGPAIVAPIDGGRTVGIDLTAPSALDRFGGAGDPIVAGRHLAGYLSYCGAASVVLPDALADRTRRQALERQAEEDALGPDRLDLLLTLLDRHGLSAWLDVAMDGPLPGLPDPDSDATRSRGLARIGRDGKADGPGYHPIHAEVRGAMGRRVGAVAAARRSHASVAGVLIRLGPGSTLLGRPDSGLDDATFARFVAAKFDPGLARAIPGLEGDDNARFEARARFLDGDGQKPWLAWRTAELAGVYVRARRGRRAGRARGPARRGDARPRFRRGRRGDPPARPRRPGAVAGVAVGRARPGRVAVGRGARGADRPAGRRALVRGVRPRPRRQPRAGRPGGVAGRPRPLARRLGPGRIGVASPRSTPPHCPTPRPPTSRSATPWRRWTAGGSSRRSTPSPAARSGSAASPRPSAPCPRRARARPPRGPRRASPRGSSRRATAPRPTSPWPTTRPTRSRWKRSSAAPRAPASRSWPGSCR